MESFTIYHNPRCSKSRAALAILRQHNVSVQVIEYLKAPLSVSQLEALRKKLGLTARDLVRDSEPEYAALGLDRAEKSAAEILAAVAQHPILLQRPIIERGARAVIGRPPENVHQLL